MYVGLYLFSCFVFPHLSFLHPPLLKSFCSALSEELTEFYKLIAVLEAQQQPQTAAVPPAGSGWGQLTLRRLLVWTHDPLERLKYLAVLVGACKG